MTHLEDPLRRDDGGHCRRGGGGRSCYRRPPLRHGVRADLGLGLLGGRFTPATRLLHADRPLATRCLGAASAWQSKHRSPMPPNARASTSRRVAMASALGGRAGQAPATRTACNPPAPALRATPRLGTRTGRPEQWRSDAGASPTGARVGAGSPPPRLLYCGGGGWPGRLPCPSAASAHP